jgi:hypothetical protein
MAVKINQTQDPGNTVQDIQIRRKDRRQHLQEPGHFDAKKARLTVTTAQEVQGNEE